MSSLFTNIPCDLVIESLDRRISEIKKESFIPYDVIIDCAKFIFNNNYFVFNKKFYIMLQFSPWEINFHLFFLIWLRVMLSHIV